MKSEVLSSVTINHMDGVHCYVSVRKLSQERKHTIYAGLNKSLQMQHDLREMKSHMLW